MRLFTNQSSKLLLSYKTCIDQINSARAPIILAMLIIWLFSTLILTQQLKNLLLDIYFIVKTAPLLNSAEDICNNQDLILKTSEETILDFKELDLCHFNSKQWEKFIKKVKYLESWNDLLLNDHKTLQEVINGRNFIMCNTYERQSISQIYEMKNHFYNPDNRYQSVITSLGVRKDHHHFENISFL